MIYGIGTDIVAVERLTELHLRHAARLAARILAEAEWADYAEAADKARFLAKRFAAKEALAKALGTGLRAPVRLTSIGVEHDALGRPSFVFASELADWLTQRGICRVHLSLSDERDYALAYVIAEAGA